MKYLLVLVLAVFSVVSLVACDQDSKVTSDVTGSNKNIDKEVRAPRGSIYEYGIYNPTRKGRERGDLSTNTGKVVTLSVLELAEQTNRIPLVKGTYFAYRYRITDLPKKIGMLPIAELRSVLTHPPMTLPDGTTTEGWDKTTRQRVSVGQVAAFDGYVFSEDYELVEGEWVFQLWLGEQMMTEQKFITYWPEEKSDNKTEDKSGETQKSTAPSDVDSI